jgi:hypothetical protein
MEAHFLKGRKTDFKRPSSQCTVDCFPLSLQSVSTHTTSSWHWTRTTRLVATCCLSSLTVNYLATYVGRLGHWLQDWRLATGVSKTIMHGASHIKWPRADRCTGWSRNSRPSWPEDDIRISKHVATNRPSVLTLIGVSEGNKLTFAQGTHWNALLYRSVKRCWAYK